MWTGADARRLRKVALRMSLREFADHLGVSHRTVSKWEHGGAALQPRPHMQAMLDTALHRADDEARARFMNGLARREEDLEQGTVPPLDTRGIPNPAAGARRYGATDIARVHATVASLSRNDQSHGGGQAHAAVAEYLARDVLPMLHGTYANASTKRAMFSAAGEAAYLAGWTAFDDGHHIDARRFFATSVEFADEAADPALAGHTLRAMAHQAIELEEFDDALEYAEASVDTIRYRAACARERSLLGVVHARALAAAGLGGASGAALVRAENDLGRATESDGEPARVFFFTEASLAHETGRTLYATGDLKAAATALDHSVKARGVKFARTQAVTLGYLGEIHAAGGRLDQACATWSQALDAATGIRSDRVTGVVRTMRHVLEPVRTSDPDIQDLDERAADYLAAV